MRPDVDYIIAYATIWGYCVAVRVFSLRKLEQQLWPRMCGPISIRREVFYRAARDVMWALSRIDAEFSRTHSEEKDDSSSFSDPSREQVIETLPPERGTDRTRRRPRKAE